MQPYAGDENDCFFLFEVMEHWRNEMDRENQGTWGESCPSATLSITNLTRTQQGMKVDLRGGKPAANRLSHGAAFFFTFLSSFGDHNDLF
jgi:hypothetical protein